MKGVKSSWQWTVSSRQSAVRSLQLGLFILFFTVAIAANAQNVGKSIPEIKHELKSSETIFRPTSSIITPSLFQLFHPSTFQPNPIPRSSFPPISSKPTFPISTPTSICHFSAKSKSSWNRRRSFPSNFAWVMCRMWTIWRVSERGLIGKTKKAAPQRYYLF